MSKIGELLAKYESDLLQDWIAEMAGGTRRKDLLKESELRDQCTRFISGLQRAASSDNPGDIDRPEFDPLKELLGDISRSRTQQGFSPTEVATFVFSFKKPLFARLRKEAGKDADTLAAETWTATELLDKLGMYTTEIYQKSRDAIIARQQEDMLELSTPVVKLWEGVLALPLIGTLDSNRTQVVMETLLQKIIETGSEIAIIDITGVPTVDTLVAQHLLRTVTATRLMGADCIISGIRPQIAQTIVHLGVALGDVTTKASLADAFSMALQRRGLTITRTDGVGR